MWHRSFVLVCLAFITAAAQQGNEALLQRYSQEGEKALAAGRYEEAAQAYEKLRDLAPNIAEIQARLGLVYFQQGRFDKAAPPLRQALKLKPQLSNTDILLAMTLSELGQYNEALPGLQKGFKRSTDAALKRSSGLQLQRAYTGLQQDDKAVEVALELIRAFPKDPEILYHAGRLFGNFAYLSTVKLAEVAPDSLWLHLAAGEANESQGRIDVALVEYRQVLALNSRHPGVHFRIGRALLARGKQTTNDTTSEPEALKDFEAELELDPTNANAAYEAAEIHRKNAQFEKAKELFTQALSFYPEFEEALVGLGRTLISLGKPELALAPLQKAVGLDPQDEVSHYQIAQVYRALGKPEEQQKSLAEYQRLKALKSSRSETAPLSRSEATRQQLDAKPPQ